MAEDNGQFGVREFESLSKRLPNLRFYDTYITINDRFVLNGTINTKSLVNNVFDLDLNLISSKNPTEALPFLARLPQLKKLKPQMGQYIIHIHGKTPNHIMINDEPLNMVN